MSLKPPPWLFTCDVTSGGKVTSYLIKKPFRHITWPSLLVISDHCSHLPLKVVLVFCLPNHTPWRWDIIFFPSSLNIDILILSINFLINVNCNIFSFFIFLVLSFSIALTLHFVSFYSCSLGNGPRWLSKRVNILGIGLFLAYILWY